MEIGVGAARKLHEDDASTLPRRRIQQFDDVVVGEDDGAYALRLNEFGEIPSLCGVSRLLGGWDAALPDLLAGVS